MRGIKKNSGKSRIPMEMPKSPVRDFYGLPYSQMVMAEQVLEAKRERAYDVIAESFVNNVSPGSLVYNELTELACEGEDVDAFGIGADLVADEWMRDYLDQDPLYRDKWYPEGEPSPMSQIREECGFIDAVLDRYGDTAEALINRFNARMWDIIVFKGRSFLTVYKGFFDESVPTDDLNMMDKGIVYAIWLDRPYKSGGIGDAGQTRAVSGTRVA